MNFLKKFNLLISQPGILFRYRSFKIREFYFILSKYLHIKTFFSRKRKINKKSNFNLKGFEKIEMDTLNKHKLNINLVISDIEDKIKNFNFSNNKNNLKSIEVSEIFDSKSNVFNFLTSQYLINIVSDYLGCIPILTYSSIWYSDNKENIDNSSQKYHLDHEDYKQVKGFLYLEDIDENNGAMNLFSPKNSMKVIKELNYNTSPDKKRVGDEIFSKYENEKVVCRGKKGTLYLVDTSQCFHCGARKSLKSRLLLTFQFITPWANYLKWNWKKSEIIKKNNWDTKDLNDIQKKVIGIN
ncbi:MAG: hypothetical protein CMA12_00345 [Euryarchaeota archaeon]|nr:hypothetical protein [Euryarchaeota archaeon]|tara:strand:- start:12785 stop:13675 length:891 start_codon:yes stop_codon:yes gene_type:complete